MGSDKGELTVITSVAFEPVVWNVPGPVDVVANLNDGTTVALFRDYPDELNFSAEELTGMTVEQVRSLHHHRDLERLRSR